MSDLIPPDRLRCQCEIRAAHGPFVLGPKPKHKRCENKPTFLAVEMKPGKDGKRGAMSLCTPCAEMMLENADLRARVQLQPLMDNSG